MFFKSITQKIQTPFFSSHKIDIFIKRDDQIHPIISGNKFRKLTYNLQLVNKNSFTGIITFGGAFSNHIHAAAYACYQQQIPAIGIIRGEHNYENNYTLSWAKHWGMQLIFVDRKTYRERNERYFLKNLQNKYPNYFIIPEGGSNHLALKGVGEIISELNQQTDFDTVITPVGSGGTLAGLIAADKERHNIIGISVLKENGYLSDQVRALLPSTAKQYNNWKILSDFHGGGYAKFSQTDAENILQFSQMVGIDFEPIYSGKMILALLSLIQSGYFPENHKIVLLHTGGLQGLAGMYERGLLDESKWPKLPTNRLMPR